MDSVAPPLEDASRLVVEAMSDLFATAGLKSSSGRVWTSLYLAGEPLDALQLKAQTGLSAGAVSMAVSELLELEIVHRGVVPGTRRFCYTVESELWQIVKRVFKERTRRRLEAPISKIREAEALLLARGGEEGAAPALLEQVRYLLRLGDFALDLFDAFLERTRVEMKAARRWLSVSGKIGREPLSRLRRRLNAASDDKPGV